MGDDSDSDSFLRQKRKRKVRYVIEDDDDDEASTSDSSIEITWHTKRIKASKKNCIQDSDTDSDSSIEVIRRKKRIGRVNSDTSNSSSSTIIIRKTRRGTRAISETSTEDGGFAGSSDSSQWETEDEQPKPSTTSTSLKEQHSSDSSDEQVEKCPICLLRFKQQEIGTPEACDHHFCVDCIQEWSKNVNTCPVDRQQFSLILVRRTVNGKVVRQIPVEPPNPQNLEVEEDAAFCEICGSSDREDRMLLCDGCNRGFHLECLTPPLEEVPEGYWYCDNCSNEIDLFDIELLFEDDEEEQYLQEGIRRNVSQRLMPRTRQNERVRQRVQRHRRNSNNNSHESENGTNPPNQAGPSTSSPTTSRRRVRHRRRGYRTVYEMDAANGETIQVRRRIKKRRNRRRRKARAAARKQKTVKRRLAAQLGICRQRSATQHVPDVRAVGGHSNSILMQRHEAGIPTLHLFGQDDEIDYFSGSDLDTGGAAGVLFRRRPTRNDANILRNQMRRKMISVPASALPSSDDLLGSILESQTRLHSKNCVLSLNKDGSLKVETNNNRININNNNSIRYRQTPMQPTNRNENNVTNTTNSFITSDTNSSYNSFIPTAPTSSSSVIRSTSDSSDFERAQDYTQSALCDAYYKEEQEKKEKKGGENNKNCDSISGENTPKSTASVHSDSELDIYSDIETVSTSKMEEQEEKPNTPVLLPAISATGTDDENNDSDTELVIDTEKLDSSDKYDPSAPIDSEESSKEETVSSSVDAAFVTSNNQATTAGVAHSTSELQSEKVQSTSQVKHDNDIKAQSEFDEDDGDEDGCPNFSIYSTESINLAKTTDLELLSEKSQQECGEISSTPTVEEDKKQEEETPKSAKKMGNSNALYSDSEDDVKIEVPKSFGIGDIQNMTEDISEEERSYTPCLDEKTKEGLDGLDTELISDEDRNDFDESHDLKTASDGDALEINAKESELDFTKPEDFEEGEIVDKLKLKKQQQQQQQEVAKKDAEEENGEKERAPAKKEDEQVIASDGNKESEKPKQLEFKKLSKSNKERNYRDKERSRSRSKDRKERKKEKRKEIERYDVRTIIAEKPRRLKDKFGRDVSKRSPSRSSRSLTPYRSPSRNHRSVSHSRKRRSRSRHRRSYSRSRTPDRRYSKSVEHRRSRSRNRKRRRSSSYDEEKSKRDRSRRRERSRSRHRAKKRSKEWTPSSPEVVRHVSPSWTPPRVVDTAGKAHNLTVIVTNESNKKKEKKKKKSDKKSKESEKKKKRRNKTPPPSKEVFASGDNILVSVSFNKDNETRDVTTKRKKEHSENVSPPKKPKKAKSTSKTRKVRDLSGVKPVAIIDLDKSPFKELTPSPKDIIVLSDSDNGEPSESMGIQKAVCDSSQHVASPEVPPMGPKTPPEPQVKFSLNPKPQQLRPISNPLHESDEAEAEMDTQEERPPEVVHKGPNTPPEPPNSPPSSPDAYDPFEPTKSRSATPEPIQTNTQSNNSISVDNESRPAELTDKANTPPDVLKSHTPPLLETQPDSQSSILTNTPDNRTKSPDVTLNTQAQNAMFSTITSKPVASATPYSSSTSAASMIITSTPVSSNLSVPRINILSSTILTPPNVVSSAQQRIVLPNTVKSSPVKVPIKSTPIKPMPTKQVINKRKFAAKNENNSEVVNLDFDSPYSPGSSDYEDLFEPPPEGGIKPQNSKATPQKTTTTKPQNAFDSLFGSSPVYGANKNKGSSSKNDKTMNKGTTKKPTPLPSKGTKQIGVKLDEDNLKILDELPNSAVEMQVKDKFLKKLNRQERVVEEVKLVLKPHYNKKHINKEEYKDILRRAVPKICHNRSGEINPKKIQNLIEAYVKKIRHSKKVTSSSSSVNPQKA